MKDTVIWPIVVVVARRIVVPALVATVALLLDAAILDGAGLEALRLALSELR